MIWEYVKIQGNIYKFGQFQVVQLITVMFSAEEGLVQLE